MTARLKNNETITIRHFQMADTPQLSAYLNGLSTATRQRFAPHGFDEASIINLYRHPSYYMGFVAFSSANELIGYAVLKIGYLQHEAERLSSYGLQLHTLTDSSFAPSIADSWQSSGAGTAMIDYVKKELKKFGIKRMFLWGGVQGGNEIAVNFYTKHRFQLLGTFEYHGNNLDMMLQLDELSH